MTQEDKQLLLADLCARLPYGVKAQVCGWDEEKGEVEVPLKVYSINTDGYLSFEYNHYSVETVYVEDCRLVLRPMSSMTEEEKEDLLITLLGKNDTKYFQVLSDGSIDNNDAAHQDLSNFNIHWINFDGVNTSTYIDWLNKNYFDYRGLIPKGLAIEAPDGMYEH